MNPRSSVGDDEAMLRSAARRIGWQIAASCAVAVAVVGAVAVILASTLRHDRGGGDGPHDLDDVLRTTAIVAGVVGVCIAGAVGFLIARRAVAPLGDALARQRRFVADAGHELRTPLTVLHTRAQLIARRMRSDDPARPAVDQLLDDSRALADIVDDLLTSAQLGAVAHDLEVVDLAEIAATVVDELRILADEAAVELVATSGPDGGFEVLGSRTALRRAVTALVDNALGHTPAGGLVTVDVGRRDGDVVLAVVDNGEGLHDDPARLVERFSRGREDRPTAAGGRRFGLGLALVREIAVGHGGRVELTPGPTGGTRAAVRIPVQRPRAAGS